MIAFQRQAATHQQVVSSAQCRACGTALSHLILDLGMSPLCQRHVPAHGLTEPELFFPLRLFLCGGCGLVQLEATIPSSLIFGQGDYTYFTSFSETASRQAAEFAAAAISRFNLHRDSLVVEVGSNDGYLLQHFVARNLPCLGIEPAPNAAALAAARGVQTRTEFFGTSAAANLVRETGGVDLIVANNVLPHVPDPNDFLNGVTTLLKPDGVLTVEFQYLASLVAECQFDTIYHEHFSYFSLRALETLLARHDLRVFDVDRLDVHGGSLRVYVCRGGGPRAGESDCVRELRCEEQRAALHTPSAYADLPRRALHCKGELLRFLFDAQAQGKRVVGYGAPGKSATLLNYCGVRSDLLEFTVDRNPQKQGTFLPGTRIPVRAPSAIFETRPDYVLILPWNLRDEISAILTEIREWGGRFVIPIPTLVID